MAINLLFNILKFDLFSVLDRLREVYGYRRKRNMIKSQKSKFNPSDFKSIHSRAFCFIDDVKVYAVVSNGAMVWVNG